MLPPRINRLRIFDFRFSLSQYCRCACNIALDRLFSFPSNKRALRRKLLLIKVRLGAAAQHAARDRSVARWRRGAAPKYSCSTRRARAVPPCAPLRRQPRASRAGRTPPIMHPPPPNALPPLPPADPPGSSYRAHAAARVRDLHQVHHDVGERVAQRARVPPRRRSRAPRRARAAAIQLDPIARLGAPAAADTRRGAGASARPLRPLLRH